MKRIFQRIGVVLILASLAAGAYVASIFADRPSIAALDDLRVPPAAAESQGVSVTFLGVTTVLISDGETALLTDGFFSRPGLLAMTRDLASDPDRIQQGLSLAGIAQLDALFTVHSHYDHAMDVAEVARSTGALVVGSSSTANIARGGGLDEAQIREVPSGATLAFGAFRVHLVGSRHFPLAPPEDPLLGRAIEAPLTQPARVDAWLEGRNDTLIFEHPLGTLAVQGSAGFLEGALEKYRADALLLGVGGLGQQDDAYRDAYWKNLVTDLGAQRVFPVHWDDFTKPLGEPLVAFPRRVDDLDVTVAFLRRRAAEEGISLGLLPFAERVVLFSAD